MILTTLTFASTNTVYTSIIAFAIFFQTFCLSAVTPFFELFEICFIFLFLLRIFWLKSIRISLFCFLYCVLSLLFIFWFILAFMAVATFSTITQLCKTFAVQLQTFRFFAIANTWLRQLSLNINRRNFRIINRLGLIFLRA